KGFARGFIVDPYSGSSAAFFRVSSHTVRVSGAGRRWNVDRNAEPERRALSDLTVDADRSSVSEDDLPDDHQAQPGADDGVRLLRAREAIEQRGQGLGRDARAG